MFGPGASDGFRVAPMSTGSIRLAAMRARDHMLPGRPTHFGMATFIDDLHSWSIVYDVVEPGVLPAGVEACCVPEDAYIMIDARVFDRACLDEPRSRFTIVHELGHLILGHSKTFNRGGPTQAPIRSFENSEWQANKFAAEFLMPLDLVRKLQISSVYEMMQAFGVSKQAADFRLRDLRPLLCEDLSML